MHHTEPFIIVVQVDITVSSKDLTQPKEPKKEQERQRTENWQEKAICGKYLSLGAKSVEDRFILLLKNKISLHYHKINLTKAYLAKFVVKVVKS